MQRHETLRKGDSYRKVIVSSRFNASVLLPLLLGEGNGQFVCEHSKHPLDKSKSVLVVVVVVSDVSSRAGVVCLSMVTILL